MKTKKITPIQKIDLHNFNTILSIIYHTESKTNHHFKIDLFNHNQNKKYSLSPFHILPLSSYNKIKKHTQNKHFKTILSQLPQTIIIDTTLPYSIHFSNPQYNPKTNTFFYTYLNNTLHFKNITHLIQYQYPTIFTPYQLI